MRLQPSRRSFPAAAAVLLTLAASAGDAFAERDVDDLEDLLPREETPAERVFREELLRHGPLPRLRSDPAPVAPIRNCAEWEPATGVLIRYPLGIPYNLIRDFDDDVIVYVVVSAGLQTNAQNEFTANGVNMAQVQWLVKPTESVWTRDYGPQFIYDGNGDVAIVDHVYNRPARPNDDLTPIAFGAAFGYPVVHHDMWHTGGNYMTDGAEFSMSTDLVYDEALAANGMSPAQVDQLMNDYYGIAPYRVIDDISPTGIHHIDTWGKFLDEETILMKSVVLGHATYTALEQRATLIASLPASTGRNYDVHRIFCPNIAPSGNPASYTNSLVLNDRIYVPTFSSAVNDTAAVDAYRTAAPGYDVRGYNYSQFITDDALHCRAIGIFDPAMLRVGHVAILEEQTGPVTVSAFVDDRSEAGLTLVELRYRFDGGSWTTAAMNPAGSDTYEATIPQPGTDASVDYSVHAEDATGREAGVPRVEPAAWFTFPIQGTATSAPLVSRVAAMAPFPNPFRDATSFSFELKFPERVELSVIDVRGRLVRKLVAEERAAGTHRILWDGRDASGAQLASGVYYFRLHAAGIVYTRPAALLR